MYLAYKTVGKQKKIKHVHLEVKKVIRVPKTHYRNIVSDSTLIT